MAPEVLYKAGQRIVSAGSDPYKQTVAMANLALETIQDALSDEKISLSRQEQRWLKKLDRSIKTLPDNRNDLMERLSPEYHELYLPEEYGLPA